MGFGGPLHGGALGVAAVADEALTEEQIIKVMNGDYTDWGVGGGW